jgi:hypothetical protein
MAGAGTESGLPGGPSPTRHIRGGVDVDEGTLRGLPAQMFIHYLALKVMNPKQFSEQADSHVTAIDQYATSTVVESSTRLTIEGAADNEVYHGLTGVIRSDECVTMTRTADKGMAADELALRSLAQLIKLCPAEHCLELHTVSDFPLSEWEKMRLHHESGYSGFNCDKVRYYWRGILSDMQDNSKSLRMFKKKDEEEPQLTQAAKMYVMEKMSLKEEVDRPHPDYEPDESPSS